MLNVEVGLLSLPDTNLKLLATLECNKKVLPPWVKFCVFSFVASNISEITKNFRLGFGTFVDKEAVPFVEGPQSP